MRQWNEWMKPLEKSFERIKEMSLEKFELQRFFQIEYCLRIHERFMPHRPCIEVWSLLTGYTLSGVNNTLELRQISAIARYRVRYLRTKTSWEKWLTWYTQQPDELRLYDVDLGTGMSSRKVKNVLVYDRVDIYDQAISQSALHRIKASRWAKPGDYKFRVKGELWSVYISPFLADLPHQNIDDYLPTPKVRSPIEVTLQDLKSAARKLDAVDQNGNWLKRFETYCKNLITIMPDGETHSIEKFSIDRLFHLVGMMGSGKSTLVTLLVYHLVVQHDLHCTIMMNTIAESIRMAAFWRSVGIKAAPALGIDRGAHRLKYGQANASRLDPAKVFSSNVDSDPALRWLSGPCVLSGALSGRGPIPAGYEPCNSLLDADGRSHVCPVKLTCPIHQANQDLAESKIWIVNPASFVHSTVSEHITRADMRMLELVYRVSDLLIIDEADRVQVQWDRKWSPVEYLAGQRDALLDYLNVVIPRQFAEHGRRQLRHQRNNELSLLASEAQRLSNWVMHLLFTNHNLVEIIERQPLTNPSLYQHLASDLAVDPRTANPDLTVQTKLENAFKTYYDAPTSQTGELARMANDVRFQQEEGMLKINLHEWLDKQLDWNLETNPSYRLLLDRFQFGLLLTALDKRVDDLLRNWLWAAPEFGEHGILSQNPPEEYIDGLLESPLGNLLGYQYAKSNRDGQEGGLLKYVACYGLGRWLLLNYQSMFEMIDGVSGPHILLTSATSWAPGSAQFHLAIPPHAVLMPPQLNDIPVSKVHFNFLPITTSERNSTIRVSGVYGDARQQNIEKIALYLAGVSGGLSPIQRELDHWESQGQPRKVLLVVGSYVEVQRVANLLNSNPSWRGRILALQSDVDDTVNAWVIRRSEVEGMAGREADVLVAPLLAIQRGYNILDEIGGALLGSVYFLVRPFPVPDDLGQHLMGVHAWAMKLLTSNENVLPASFGTNGPEMIAAFRRAAYAQWRRRLGRSGLDSLDDEIYQELLWDQFVIVWQTIGRLLRGGRTAHVYFVDAAFHPNGRRRSMLIGWRDILAEYIENASTKPAHDQQLAKLLYQPAYEALKNMNL